HTANTLENFKIEIPKYLKYYNTERLHMGINYQTPQEVLQGS
ncbi:IS3 family transposase, partial [Patescibacteria group bacterium]|nr:IS3 family transposase [Patescibacteria group bacterium]